ncbi:MAG: ABC transporter ATP-binding protein [Chloroflexi bacterium]|nr:ABC transporter ATP-binding protein [Chloroflexota bacterium]
MRILLRLAAYTLKYKKQLVLTYVCLLVATLFSLAVPRLMGFAIDAALSRGSRTYLFVLAGAILGLSLFRGLFYYGQSYLSEFVAQRVAYDLRNAFYDHLQRLSFAFHDKQQTGQLMSRATVDVESVRRYIQMGLIRGLTILVLVVTVTILLFSMNWRLALVSMLFLPLVAWKSTVAAYALRRIWLRIQELTGVLTTVLQENLSGIRVVKAFGREEHQKARFAKEAQEVADETLEANRIQASNSSLMNLLFTLITALILWYGGKEVIQGRLTPGELAQFILYIGMVAWPVRSIGMILNTFSRAVSSGERLYQILDAQSPVTEKREATELPRAQGHVRFEDVHFSYDSVAPVLGGVDLDVKPGQVVALMGNAGSGKSTIASLIPRFYDASQGRITVDNVDVRDVTLASLRRNVGIVFQDVFLFNATIKDNIAYGAGNVSTDRIVQAAQVAQLHDFIQGLPQGYDTWVGERGITLSGGQRQRLAIARTILLDPPILILDDSTSSVDTETEQLIRKALAQVIQGRTTFIIAHRLSSLLQADLILVIEDGRILERGTHQELLDQKGKYRQIYDLQLKPSEEDLTQASARGRRG